MKRRHPDPEPPPAPTPEAMPPLTSRERHRGTGDVLKDLAYAQRFTEGWQDSDWPGGLRREIDFVDRALRVAMGQIKQLRQRLDAKPSPLPGEPPEARGEWQPIETAPTDGTPVLLFWSMEVGSEYVEYWACGSWTRHGWSGESFYAKPDGFWTRLIGERPTHWMPLPSPPALLPAAGRSSTAGEHSVAPSAEEPSTNHQPTSAVVSDRDRQEPTP